MDIFIIIHNTVHCFFQVVKGTIRDTRQKVSNLTENNEYQFRVCAVNKAGAGNYSEASDLYRAYDPIGMSEDFMLFLNVDLYNLKWVYMQLLKIFTLFGLPRSAW